MCLEMIAWPLSIDDTHLVRTVSHGDEKGLEPPANSNSY